MDSRAPRSLETREATKRPMVWKPTSALPTPEPRDGWVHRWNRTALMGNVDNMNISTRFREGWVPCKQEEYPELALVMSDHNSKWASEKGCLEVGGLLLCKAPQELIDSRTAHFQRINDNKMQALDNELLATQDPSSNMSIHTPERTTSFGRGGEE